MNERTMTEHPGPDTLRSLHFGWLGYRETASLNAHKRRCPECRAAYDEIAATPAEPPSAELLELGEDFVSSYRRMVKGEISVQRDEKLELKNTSLDIVLSGLLDQESSRFLVTPGKLESLAEDFKGRIKKLEETPSLTPEGEKSFISFLARCVEENTRMLSGDESEVDLEQFAEILASLQEVADGNVFGLQGKDALAEVGGAFRDKASRILNELREMAGGA